MRNSSFVLALRYCRRSKLVFTSFCFQIVPKRELTSAAWIMDRNSQKWSQKGYHSLPFAAKVSVWRSFEQFHSLNNRHRNFPHQSIPPCNLYKWKVFLTACRNTAAYCIIFLTVWNSWLRQQISKIPSLYKVSLSFCWNDEGKQAVKTKAECFKAWRLFLFSSLFLSNMHYSPSVRSVWLDIWLVSFWKVLQRFIESQRQKVTSKCAIVLLYWLFVIEEGRSVFSLHFASRQFQNHTLLRQLE